MYNRLELNNFTVFAKTEFEFVAGINAYVGTNGTGKTHILKLLYAIQKHQVLSNDPSHREPLDVTLMSVFKPNALGRLVRRLHGGAACDVRAVWNNKTLTFHLATTTKQVDSGPIWPIKSAPIFIPAKDILGHSVNFVDAYDTVTSDGGRWLDFDVTYRDLLTHANPDVPRGPTPETQKPLLRELRKQMQGTVTKHKSGRYYLTDAAGGIIEFPLVAEGWRKLGLLWTLIRNGSLTRGSVLYWDEPEANLNPSMFNTIAGVLTTLAKSGTQIHIASHSYAFLRELEFEATAKEVPLGLFALNRTKTDGVTANPASRFVELEPNPILDEYDQLFRRTVKEAFPDAKS
jgi:energy-coupling factor transporter ATP-binding protein EcfA2